MISTFSSKATVLRAALLFVVALLFVCTSASVVQAQDLSRIQQLRDQMPSHYSFVRTGEQSINVVVIGSVVRPGTYEVRPDTDLNTLFLYTGGPSMVGVRSREKTPDVNIFLSRPGENGRRIIYETDFASYIDEDVEFPELQELDMIIVETDPVPEAFWRQALSLGSQILSIVTSLVLIIWRLNRN